MKSILTIDRLTLQLVSASETLFNHKYITLNYLLAGNTYAVAPTVELRYIAKLEKYYLHSWAIWIDGWQVATLSTDCRQKGQGKSISLAFANEVFYTVPGWAHYWCQIQTHFPLIAKGISYLEISADFQLYAPLLPKMSDFFRHSTFIAENPNAKFGPLLHQQKCSLLHGAEYIFGNSLKGNKGSGKQVVFYPKSPEITARGKDYMWDYYAQNGFDLSQPVERVEVRLSSRYLSKFLVGVAEINDIQVLGNIFRVAVGDTFTFRVLGKYHYDANRNRKSEIVTLIEFADFSNEPLAKRPRSIQDDESEWRNRAEAKNTVLRFIARGNAQDWAQLIHISQEVRAPSERHWMELFRLYALDYKGTPTPERTTRIDMFR